MQKEKEGQCPIRAGGLLQGKMGKAVFCSLNRKMLRKYRTFALLLVIIIPGIVLPAAAGDKKKPAKIAYEFPSGMAAAVREQFTRECDKGQALYNLACANCHNTSVNGKTIVPDWTGAQLVGYELRVLNPKHEAGIPEEQVTAEELGMIMTFLTYKQKNVPAGIGY